MWRGGGVVSVMSRLRLSCRMMRPCRRSPRALSDDGEDDRAARDRHLPERRDVDHRQRVVDDAEEQRAEHARRPTEPMPPAIETPPMTQAAMMLSS